MESNEILARNLRRYRAERGISREQFAFESGISARFLNEIENAKCHPTTQMLDTLSAAMGIPASKLIEYDGDY